MTSAAEPGNHADVIVVGAGFAGIVAARELRKAAHSAIVLEARDRIGGRTWTAERLGFRLELGGTWVHWLQPHVWVELTRYDIGIVPSPEPTKIAWAGSGDVKWLSPDEFFGWLDAGQRDFLEDVQEVFPLPFDPLHEEERVAALDGASMADRLKELDLSDEDYLLNHTMWSMHFNAPCDEGALTQGLRWAALGAWDWQRLLEACATYKPQGGMSNLIGKIADDAQADVRFETTVTRIEQDAAGCRVRTEDGSEYTGDAVIVALPVNTLGDLEFDPPLSAGKQAFAKEGQVSHGYKLWVRVRGKHDPLIAVAAPPHPLTLIQAECWDDDATVFVGFGLESGALDIEDHDAVREALRVWMPDVELEACTGHEWTTDRFSKGTWAMLRPRQLTKYLRAAQAPEHKVLLAGSDFATGWSGFVDGAIESGIRAAANADAVLGSG
jgi:monoamine oxidase